MTDVLIIDNGAPQYDPRTQIVERTWVDSEETVPDAERARDDDGNIVGPETRTIRTATYEIQPRPVTADDIRAEARKRIIERYPTWKQLNNIRDGGGELAVMSAYIDAVRASSSVLEIALPADFASDAHWPE